MGRLAAPGVICVTDQIVDVVSNPATRGVIVAAPLAYVVESTTDGSTAEGVVRLNVVLVSVSPVPALYVIGAVPFAAAVTSPLAFTVIFELVKLPTFEFTVASVDVVTGPVAVTSPVRAVKELTEASGMVI
jgi:hypothetical protein